jgi:hypothetical protein
MAEVIHDTQQDFWRPPVTREAAREITVSEAVPTMAEACPYCSSEFLLGARFCHACGAHRLEKNKAERTLSQVGARAFLEEKVAWLQSAAKDLSRGDLSKHKFALPSWLRYLHFHEIQRGIGLPTAPLVAFMIGLGCVAGAIGVSLFYKASTLAEFQAIQMWRIEWLLGATASFVAGILLKKPSPPNHE